MTREFEPFDDNRIVQITIRRDSPIDGPPILNPAGVPVEQWSVTMETPTVRETHHPFKSVQQAVWSLSGRLARHTDSLVMVGAGGTSSMQKPQVKGEGQ